jgi:hypothetical protein
VSTSGSTFERGASHFNGVALPTDVRAWHTGDGALVASIGVLDRGPPHPIHFGRGLGGGGGGQGYGVFRDSVMMCAPHPHLVFGQGSGGENEKDAHCVPTDQDFVHPYRLGRACVLLTRHPANTSAKRKVGEGEEIGMFNDGVRECVGRRSKVGTQRVRGKEDATAAAAA